MSTWRPAALSAMLRPGIEDHAVFPLLATRMDVSKLQQDHAEMDAIIENVEQACFFSSVGSPEVHTLTVFCVPTRVRPDAQ
jgi:hypothetical protein